MARPINSIRKITRVGRAKSFSIVIPAEIMRSLGWREKQRVLVKRVARGVSIIDAKTKKKK
ncbi:MAG TPA: AbrB/MazE/SpoVT family DNA-binding domain-containing protein [Candidatus Paceibacterota bacterium]